jgi:hypothetical protein
MQFVSIATDRLSTFRRGSTPVFFQINHRCPRRQLSRFIKNGAMCSELKASASVVSRMRLFGSQALAHNFFSFAELFM